VTLNFHADGEKAGLIVTGMDYSYVSVRKHGDSLVVSQTTCKDADKQTAEKESAALPVKGNVLYLRVKVTAKAVCNFSFSKDGAKFSELGAPFQARKGKWIGAKVGIFATGTGAVRENGYADFDWFRVE